MRAYVISNDKWAFHDNSSCVRSLADLMDGPLMRTQQEYQGGDIIFLMAAGTTLTALCSALRLSGQTETADRALTVKEEDYRAG